MIDPARLDALRVSGVTLLDPSTTFIDDTVTVGPGAVGACAAAGARPVQSVRAATAARAESRPVTSVGHPFMRRLPLGISLPRVR